MMSYSKTGRALTERFEGVRLISYQDQVGRWTIGYGHTRAITEGMTCTEPQADAWLDEDTALAVQDVNTHVATPLSQGEFDALVDFAFNLGNGALNNSTLLKDLNEGNYLAAANEFDKWDMAGGQHVAGILRRRQAESNEFTWQQAG